MPAMQTALTAMNQSFSAASLAGIDAESFRPGYDTSLVSALSAVPGLDLPDEILEYLDSWPTALQRAAQAVIWENLTRDGSVPMTFAWTPGYDYSVTFHDVVDTDETAGGITVLFSSRYPRDPHPLTTTRADAP